MIRLSFSSPIFRLAAIAAYVLSARMFIPDAHAQTPTPSQIETFRNLPPEQQQTILDTLRRQGGGDSAQPSGGELRFPQVVEPRTTAEMPEELDQRQRREPRLKGDDTVLLLLDILKFEPRPDQPLEDSAAEEQSQGSEQQIRSPGQLTNREAKRRARNEALGEPEQIERSEQDVKRLQEFRDRILRRNPYRLDKWGILQIPELGPVPLGGLTVDEAQRRLSAEYILRDFQVTVTRLPLRATGTDALKPFGYDLFAGKPTTFAPATDIPVPSDYVVGPGDRLELQLVGNTKMRTSLVVGRDGRVDFPELGPIAVGGQRFEEVRSLLEQRVRDQMIGTQANISMGELRSIRVFVLGDAETPGSYTVSGLSTITNALFVSGGIKKIGSLRNIELKRAGRTVTQLDLYDLLLKGDTSADVRLLPGDVIFVPPIGPTVSLAGEVHRPAIYELKHETSARDLVALGGGFTAQADPKLANLERVSDLRQRITVNVDLEAAAGQGAALRGGDVLRIPGIRPVLENSVTLSGHVYRPGEFQYRRGMRLTDVLPSVDELQPNADQRYLLIRRELPPNRQTAVFSADLSRAVAQPGSAADFELEPRDRIYVFDMESGRDRIIEPLLRELAMQSRIGEPTAEVTVLGRIKAPGKYPLEPGMRVSDLLRAGGSLDEAAHGGRAEIMRYTVGDDGARQASLIEIDLQRLLNGDPAADIALRPFDRLVVKEVPLWETQEEVEVRGEVRFPGRYPIHRGETLRSLLERAGGLTDLAFVPGAVFTRQELKERERKQIETLANRMQSDVAQFSLQTAQETGKDAGQALAIGQSLLTELRSAKPVGRLVIDLNKSMSAAPGSQNDIVLKDHDQLLVPRVTQEVTVIGEVQSTTSHLYNRMLARDDYLQMSGGLTARADEDRVYVVKADGSVVTRSGNSWFTGGGPQIDPGDTIVAPLDTERMRPLPFWQAVTTIVYNLAISAAAVNSF